MGEFQMGKVVHLLHLLGQAAGIGGENSSQMREHTQCDLLFRTQV